MPISLRIAVWLNFHIGFMVVCRGVNKFGWICGLFFNASRCLGLSRHIFAKVINMPSDNISIG